MTHIFWQLHFGWEYTPEQALWLNAGGAPTFHVNWFTYLRPSVRVALRW